MSINYKKKYDLEKIEFYEKLNKYITDINNTNTDINNTNIFFGQKLELKQNNENYDFLILNEYNKYNLLFIKLRPHSKTMYSNDLQIYLDECYNIKEKMNYNNILPLVISKIRISKPASDLLEKNNGYNIINDNIDFTIKKVVEKIIDYFDLILRSEFEDLFPNFKEHNLFPFRSYFDYNYNDILNCYIDIKIDKNVSIKEKILIKRYYHNTFLIKVKKELISNGNNRNLIEELFNKDRYVKFNYDYYNKIKDIIIN